MASPRHEPDPIVPRQGVVTLFGYGISVSVDRGHLLVQDGIGTSRRRARLPRVGHGLKRLVIIGADGMISLAALRWLSDQDAAFVMLDRDGTVLATTGPVRPSDAKLRRAQALAVVSGAAVVVARELISRKLAGQEQVAREKLLDDSAAEAIAGYRFALAQAETLSAISALESKAAAAYWGSWRNLPITFPSKDIPKVPEHWRRFDTRKSPLSGSQRLAANPANAILNYLYSLLEAESRLALAALGLDPGIGVLHLDTPARDSFACDLMEAVRPQVDGYVLDWITRHPVSREWFFEKRDGNCRLMAPLAAKLAETVPMWARALAPVAEWITRTFWATTKKRTYSEGPATRLTQDRKREARGNERLSALSPTVRIQRICETCGTALKTGIRHCSQCAVTVSTQRMPTVAEKGRLTSHLPEANSKRSKKQTKHAEARYSWKPSDQPVWLTETIYVEKIQPLIARASNSLVATALGVSRVYASRIRKGHRPHPRHWVALAQLVAIAP